MKNDHIPIYLEIYEDYKNKILDKVYKQGDKLPCELDICKQYYVSRITVQKALKKLVDQGMITRIAGKGSFVSLGEKKNEKIEVGKIGLILCDFSITYGMDLIKSIEYYAHEHNKCVIFKNSAFDKDRETDAIIELLQQEVEGIILHPIHNEYFNSEILKLSINKFPMVLIDRNLSGVQMPFVGTDNRYITGMVMDYLFKMGHKHICFMNACAEHTTTIEEREDAFLQAYVRYNYVNSAVNLFRNIKSPLTNPNDQLIEEDVAAIKKHIVDNPQLTCIFAGEYRVCSLVKRALKELNYAIPEDMSLVTFDNICDMFYFTKTAYVKQNEREIGKRAVEILCDKILGETSNSKVYLSGEFVVNESIKNLNINSKMSR